MGLKSLLKKNSGRWAITDKMFFSLFLTGSIIEFSQVGAGFIDGLIVSRFLGPEAMAAQGIVYPIFSILGIISKIASDISYMNTLETNTIIISFSLGKAGNSLESG